mgnify:CR=1 FL=1
MHSFFVHLSAVENIKEIVCKDMGMTDDTSLGLEFKYLIVNDMDRKFGLWVNTVGYQSIPPDSPYPLKELPAIFLMRKKAGCFVNTS